MKLQLPLLLCGLFKSRRLMEVLSVTDIHLHVFQNTTCKMFFLQCILLRRETGVGHGLEWKGVYFNIYILFLRRS